MHRFLRIPFTSALAALLIAPPAIGFGAAAAAPDPETPSAPASAIVWGACDASIDPMYQCASLPVPLDYANPAAGALSIALVRLPADPALRQGAMLFNPGGPGGSGFESISRAGDRLDRALGLGRRFDIVGFDPRGVGRSGEIRCVSDDLLDIIYYTGDEAATRSPNPSHPLADECLAIYGDTLRHFSTENTARDMDAIRAGMGDEQISFLGVSYGTYLGAVYATLFPERVRAMVLDSAFDPTEDTDADHWMTQLIGFEQAFNNWAAWCQRDATCAFHAPDVAARWDGLMSQLAVEPIEVPDGRSLSNYVLLDVTLSMLYSDYMWRVFARTLVDAEAGNGEALMAMADESNHRNPDGTYQSGFEAGRVIRCASGLDHPAPADPAAMLAEVQAQAPRMAQLWVVESFDVSLCPALVGGRVQPIVPNYQGSAPILVIGGINDPATPYRWAPELLARMGPSATLVSYSGEGHGYVLDSRCVSFVEGDLIADLDAPPPQSTCGPDPALPAPALFSQLPRPAGVSDVAVDPTIAFALGYRPSDWFTEVRYLTVAPKDVEVAYTAALVQSGLRVTRTWHPRDGVVRIELLGPDGNEYRIEIVSPEALVAGGSEPVAGGLTLDGAGYVVLAARAPAPAR